MYHRDHQPVQGHHGVIAPIPDVFVLFRLGSHWELQSPDITRSRRHDVSIYQQRASMQKMMAAQHTNLYTQHEILTYWNIRKARLETDEMSMISCCVFGRFIEFLVFLVVMDGSKVVLEGLVEWDKR